MRKSNAAPHDATVYPPDSRRFDWLVILCSTWMLAGLFLDGWAHNTLRGAIETFFTPWHAVLYSGFLATACLLGFTQARNMMRGYPWVRALPRGYSLSLLGMGIFVASGAADFAWHNTFGFEIDVEALLSPPHLALASGGFLIMVAPLRAAWQRPSADKPGWRAMLPALISLLNIYSVFTFFTQFSNPFTHANVYVGNAPFEDAYFWDVTAISYVLIPAGMMMGVILLALRRWALPVGSLTMMITVNAALMFTLGISYSGEQWRVLLAALAGGVLADLLAATLKPSAGRPAALRLFAFLTPFLVFLLYFTTLILSGGIWWRIHMWLGAPFLAGLLGLGLSLLLAPPALPDAD